MESGPLSTPEFKEFAKDVVLFCHITTRIPGRKHDDLLGKKGGRGFPYLVYMDAEGKVIGKPAGRSVQAFRDGARYLTLAQKEDLTTEEGLELIGLGLRSGQMKPADAKKRAEGLELDEAQRAKVDAMIKEAEGQAKIAALMGQLRSRQDVQSKGPEVGKQLWALYQEGVKPSGDGRQALGAYQLMLMYAEKERVLEPAQVALKALKEALAKEPRAKQFLQQMEAKVKALEESLKKGE